ncbi:BRCA1-associated RING domain protein 1 [Astathelohania contejeani]|uniref:BRCA1-associated RING domain protein 1 n=1 Tax=Astathelohania contejeani TaxID=164912 RepID=A0ABQ7I2J6_9MICR|nr:BRCA1-associated RING domain protein 1 [Thelohania contejeani]
MDILKKNIRKMHYIITCNFCKKAPACSLKYNRLACEKCNPVSSKINLVKNLGEYITALKEIVLNNGNNDKTEVWDFKRTISVTSDSIETPGTIASITLSNYDSENQKNENDKCDKKEEIEADSNGEERDKIDKKKNKLSVDIDVNEDHNKKECIIDISTNDYNKNEIIKDSKILDVNYNEYEENNNEIVSRCGVNNKKSKKIVIKLNQKNNKLKSNNIEKNQNEKDTFRYIGLLTSGLNDPMVNFIERTHYCHPKVIIELFDSYNSKCTHLVVNSDEEGLCNRTEKYLLCLMTGIPIVSFKWYKMLFKGHDPDNVKPFFIKGDKACRVINMPWKIYNKGGFKPFLNVNFIIDAKISKELRRIVKCGGGVINGKGLVNYTLKDQKEVFDLISKGAEINTNV